MDKISYKPQAKNIKSEHNAIMPIITTTTGMKKLIMNLCKPSEYLETPDELDAFILKLL